MDDGQDQDQDRPYELAGLRLRGIGHFYRHNAMHDPSNASVAMVTDEWGRCEYCVKLGYWRADA